MVGCQAEGAACYAKAIEAGSPRPIRVPHPKTIALSIACDEEIQRTALDCARAGLAIGPASAAAVAVALSMPAKPSGETWVTIATGSLVKWPNLITEGF
jgi:threonine synthase